MFFPKVITSCIKMKMAKESQGQITHSIKYSTAYNGEYHRPVLVIRR